MGDNQNGIILLEEGWSKIKDIALDPLESMLDDGFKKNSRLFSNMDYAKVYTICYNMCTQKSPYNWSEQLYLRHGEAMVQYLNRSVVPTLKEQHGEVLLREFVKRGDNHTVMNKWHQKFFMYLDRYHVKYHQLASLEEAGLRHFKTAVFDVFREEVAAAVIALIDSEREDGVVDRALLRHCVRVYESMGLGSLDAYTAHLEAPLLERSSAFYAAKAQAWAAAEPLPAYMLRVEKALEDEKLRVQAYLNSETEAKLLRVVEEEALQKKEAELLEKEGSGCRVLLANDMLEDLARLHRLFGRIPDGLVPVADIFKQHITAVGNEKVEQRLARVEALGDKEKDSADDPQYVKDLLAVHSKYLQMVNDQFASNMLFQRALKDAFVELVNRDVGRFKTADLISSFCDRLLKSGSGEKLSDTETEELLDSTVQLFSYLTDKDLFADLYRNQLAKRLLNQRSASDDMERLMISKLKVKCGAQFTAKMEGMLNDLSVGAEHSQNFDKYCKENQDRTGLGKLDFSVQVLTTGHWPAFKNFDVALPPLMQRCTNVFQEYYNAKTNKRRLQWTNTLGHCVVRANVRPGGKATWFDINVTTLQAIAMLAFNKDASCPGGVEGADLSFPQLQDALQVPDDALKKVLHSLSCGKHKVIIRTSVAAGTLGADEKGKEKEGKGPKKAGSSSGPIKATDMFAFNNNFTSNTKKFRIPMALLDDGHNPKRVEEDRTVAIEAAVVRIMKARLTLQHQQLVAEVLSQLAFFKPDPKVIKKRIEALIDREYLERDPDNPNTYKYMA